MEQDLVKLKNIKPALSGYIKDAELLLESAEFPDEVIIHDVRVLMKKSRSVLRIIAPQIESDFTSRENLAMREVGRILHSQRETFVFRKTLKDLKKRYPEIFNKLISDKKISGLLKKPDDLNIHSETILNGREKALKILKKTGYHIRFEPMANLDAQLLLKELEISYNRVVNHYLMARNYTKTSNLHEFRKASKDFLYQLWFFRPLNTAVVKSLEKKMDYLTQNLGKYNDLSRLLKVLGYKYEYTANLPAVDELAIVIKEEQDRCLSKVWPAAHQLFCPGQNLVNILGFRLLII